MAGLFDALKQYVGDALPGGLLNAEVPTPGNALAGLLSNSQPLPTVGGITSGIDNIKRTTVLRLADLLTNPKDYLAQTLAQAPQTIAEQGAGLAPFGIVKPAVAKTLGISKALPEGDLFNQAVANTAGASIGEDGLTMMLQRNQAPNQSMQPSVRGGVFYLPEGAAQAKYYSTGKNGYGGTEKITGETLIQNPLFAKGGTGGKAPESAFDSLIGKGAYQAMRSDALKAYGGYGAQLSDKVAGARTFLEKYAPELADQAEYIVQNSKQGNQLAYALQEAAVASAVRNAGHDAVLGYSKGKSGPFLSELFDVRESHYPDKFGGSKVWDRPSAGSAQKNELLALSAPVK